MYVPGAMLLFIRLETSIQSFINHREENRNDSPTYYTTIMKGAFFKNISEILCMYQGSSIYTKDLYTYQEPSIYTTDLLYIPKKILYFPK
ncbi:hypothetical protein D1872_218800 [compost metagenome]